MRPSRQQGVEKAKDLCRNTRGPVASIFYQGLLRYNSGIDEVEKSIIAYGSVVTLDASKVALAGFRCL
jgi:hypothetical protein